MDHLKELAASVEADVAKDNLKELVAEELVKVTDSIFGAIPGLSVISKLGKTYQSVRDYFLMEKVMTFLTNISSLKVDERRNMIDKINNDPIYGQTFGKFIILAIDRLEYVDKAVYLARTCKFYEREHISKPLFIRLKGIIEKVELADLQKLHCSEENDYYGYPSNFDSAGLFLFQSLDLVVFEHTINDFKQYQTFESFGKSSDMPKPSRPKLTDLGKVLIHVVNDILLHPGLKSVAMRYR